MLTGVRTQEMCFATWNEVDLEKGIWEIPAERMKMRRPHIVPLSTQVITLFKQLKPITGHYHTFLLEGTIVASRSQKKVFHR